MDQRGRGLALTGYLTALGCFHQNMAAYFKAWGVGPEVASVVLFGFPAALYLFLQMKADAGEETYKIAGPRPLAAIPLMSLFLIALPLLSTGLAVAGNDSNPSKPGGMAVNMTENPWLGVALIGCFALVFFWRKRSPKTKRRHLRGKQLLFSRKMDPVPKSPDETDRGALFWGGVPLPREAARLHFAVAGVTGSGKTLTMRLLMQSVVARIGQGKDTRALIYDAKGDSPSLLRGMGAKKIHTLNPFDKRCVAPDLAADFTSPAAALQLATLLIPENPKASQPFFANAARNILTKVVMSFLRTAPGKWDLRDVILATQSKASLIEVLQRVPESAGALIYLEREDTARDILSTLAARLAPFELIAAAWYRASGKLSLRNWLKEESILILGNDESLRTAIQAVNRLLVQRLSELCLQQSESPTRETWFFLDEVREAGKFEGLGRLLTNGRSKGVCVCLGFQDIEGMRDAYGERLANEMLGQCSNKAVLRLESEGTATWASALFGQREVLEESTSAAASLNGLKGTRSNNMSLAIKKTENVLVSEFLDIPPTNFKNGLTGYYQTPYTGAFRQTLSGPWLKARLLRADPKTANQAPRGEGDQYLPPWSEADRRRLSKDPKFPSAEKVQSTPSSSRTEVGILAGL